MNVIIKDITTVSAPAVIIHGVNCQRVMASGVAKALSTKWPLVREKYLELSIEDMCLGKILPVQVADNLYVVNCFTQNRFGYDQGVYASHTAIQDCLKSVVQFCRDVQIQEIYSPRIGCGLGGLSWESDVGPLYEKLFLNYPDINVTICDI